MVVEKPTTKDGPEEDHQIPSRFGIEESYSNRTRAGEKKSGAVESK
jgi:hypothetical protein